MSQMEVLGATAREETETGHIKSLSSFPFIHSFFFIYTRNTSETGSVA
jgi:hypothetical protein